MPGRLHDKVIVIVGGTSGLGAAAARACVAEGGRVVIVGRAAESVARTEAALRPHAHGVVGDARQPETAERAIALAVERFGRLDGLYHVAGGSGRSVGDGPLHETTDAGWAQTLDWNLTSTFYSNRAAVRQLLAQGQGGAVVNMSSVLARHPAPAHFATHTYAAAKAAILGLTTSAAAYYARQNIRFHAVLPGLTDTPMAQRAVGNDTIMQYVRCRQPLEGGRAGLPSDLDGAIVFLLSEEARFLTGQVLAIDGGWSVSDGCI